MNSGSIQQIGLSLTPAWVKSPSLQGFLNFVFHTSIYAALGAIGMRVSLVSGNASPIWLASGFALALMLTFGPCKWPSVFIATFLLTYLSGLTWGACALMALGNTLEALFAYSLLRHRNGFAANGISSTNDVTALVVCGCILAPPIAGTFGALALWMGGFLPLDHLLDAWFIWTVGDAMGVLIATPIFIGFARGSFKGDLARLKKMPQEGTLIFSALIGTLVLTAFYPTHAAFLFFPIVFWAALRVGQIGVLICIFTIVASVTVATDLGYGPLAGTTMVKDLALFDLYLGFLAVGGLLAAAAAKSDLLRASEQSARIAAEKQSDSLRRAQQSLMLSEHRLMLALRTARMSAWEWTAERRLTFSDDKDCPSPKSPVVRAAIEAEILYAPMLRSQCKEVPVIIDGDRRWLEVKWKDVGSDSVRHLVGICLDVTDNRQKREQREIELQRSRSRAKELADLADAALHARSIAEGATEAKSAFVAALSHEVRNPLAVIRGFTDLLLTPEGTPAERHAWLQAIDRNSHLMASLVNDVLDLSKVEAGHLDVQAERIDLVANLKEVVSLVRLDAERKNLFLKLSFSASCPKEIVTDPTRLRQILMNVICNSIKFTEHGCVAIEVTSVWPPSQPSRIKISITDTGIGIDAHLHGRIFEPFRQANQSIQHRFGGTGLGLSLARQLAQLLGGSLELERSEPGKGSCFALTLPLVLGGTEVQPVKRAPAVRSNFDLPLDDMRILVVEDSLDNQFLCKKFLEALGAKPDTANDGLEAVEKAEFGCYDAILMDIQMPIMDGYEALRALQNSNNCVPVVALTAVGMKTERERAAAAGFRGYLTKPIDRDQMVAVLKAIRLQSNVDQ